MGVSGGGRPRRRFFSADDTSVLKLQIVEAPPFRSGVVRPSLVDPLGASESQAPHDRGARRRKPCFRWPGPTPRIYELVCRAQNKEATPWKLRILVGLVLSTMTSRCNSHILRALEVGPGVSGGRGFDGRGGLSQIGGTDSWRNSWSLIIAGNFGGNSGRSDLLFYDPRVG